MEAGDFIKDAITNNKVVLFMKGTAQFPSAVSRDKLFKS